MGWRSVPIGRIVVRLVDIANLEPGETPHGVGFLCDFGYGINLASTSLSKLPVYTVFWHL